MTLVPGPAAASADEPTARTFPALTASDVTRGCSWCRVSMTPLIRRRSAVLFITPVPKGVLDHNTKLRDSWLLDSPCTAFGNAGKRAAQDWSDCITER